MTFVDIVAEVLELDPEEVDDASSPATLHSWTSLRHLQLVVTLEEVYGLSFSRNEIKSFSSVGQIRATLQTKGVTV